MRKMFLIATLVVVMPALVQAATLGVYFDTDGDSNLLINDEFVNEAYVIAFAESMVAGAAFQMTMDPYQQLLQSSYPDGLAIGAPLDGVEIGFSTPVSGYYGVPVLVATLTLMQLAPGEVTNINIVNHPDYDTVVVSNNAGALFEADGLGATLSATVANDAISFGAVKSLFN
jgi:hypothetical protein